MLNWVQVLTSGAVMGSCPLSKSWAVQPPSFQHVQGGPNQLSDVGGFFEDYSAFPYPRKDHC